MLMAATAPRMESRPCPVRTVFEMSIGRAPATSSNGDLSKADAVWPGALRRIVSHSLSAWNLPHLVDGAGLLISELVTNAFLHGHGVDVGVRLYFSHCEFVMEVRDGSPERPVLCHAAADDDHGRGLYLVDALAAAWGVSDDGTTTWCALPLACQLAGVREPLPAAEEVFA